MESARPVAGALATRHALSDWITVNDLLSLREALVRGSLPHDFLEKLRGLAGGDISHRFIEQNCSLFAALLLAAESGFFRDVKPAERERLLRVLAYVRKDGDAIPDSFAGGFKDDQREVLAASIELGTLLQRFKAWRLRHQVPAMWSNHEHNRQHASTLALSVAAGSTSPEERP